jgi:cytochrome c peroxidase
MLYSLARLLSKEIPVMKPTLRPRHLAALVLASVLYALGLSPATASPPKELQGRPAPSLTDNKYDHTGAPPPLRSVPVPMPHDLSKYIRDMRAAQILGKALFWDMQAGSDGFTSCATCHWHAGVDVRVRNTVSPHGPGKPTTNRFRGPNQQLTENDFPFRKFADVGNAKSKVLRDTSEVVGSQGVIRNDFVAVRPGNPVDAARGASAPVFNVNGVNTRQVTQRNTPSVINAVFNDRQFWDGRASRYFNGVNPFGETDPNARVWRYRDGKLSRVRILIDNSSLASQAVRPPNNDVEMAWNGRTFPELGRKILSLHPLALQKVDPEDSILGPWANTQGKGLGPATTYATLIRHAFLPEWWDSPETVDGGFTLMEANFALFWGLSIQTYEGILVSDRTPYDAYRSGNYWALSDSAKQGLEIFLNQGKCINCHSGSEFAGGTVSELRPIYSSERQLIERMEMGNGKNAVYDNGFYNIGVRPTEEDLGVGARGPFGPFSLSRRKQLGQDIGDPLSVKSGERLAIRGAVKTPTLRNIALTGPYFRNGGVHTLEEVVEFYARGGDFAEKNKDDLDPDIEVLNDILGNPKLIQALVDFMYALTDPRVEYQRAPFDHPELLIPHGHAGFTAGRATDSIITIPATGARGGARLKTFIEILADGIPN